MISKNLKKTLQRYKFETFKRQNDETLQIMPLPL